MQFFDGKHNRRRRIALGGSSSRPATTEQILAHAKNSRQKRNLQRARESSAVIIQKYWRRNTALIKIAKDPPENTSAKLTHLVLSSSLLFTPLPSSSSNQQSNDNLIVQTVISTHSYILPLIRSLTFNLSKQSQLQHDPQITNLPPRIIASAATLFVAFANHAISISDEDPDNVVHALSAALLLLQISKNDMLPFLIRLSFITFVSKVLRSTIKNEKLQQNDIHYRILQLISEIIAAFIDHIPTEIENNITAITAYRQFAISLFPIKNFTKCLHIPEEKRVLSNILHSLAPTKSIENQDYSNQDLLKLSQVDITIFSSNLLDFCSRLWTTNNSQLLWPSVSVLSQLVRILPENALSITDTDMDDMDVDTDGEGEELKNTLTSALRHLTSVLEQIFNDGKLRVVFAKAVSEGREATVQVCYLFDFLTRRRQRLSNVFQSSLAFWRRGRGGKEEHILKSLWKICLIEDPNSSSATPTLDPDMGSVLSLFICSYRYLVYIQDADEILESTWPFTLNEIREIITVLKPYLFAALYSKGTALQISNSFAQKANMMWQEKGLVTNVSRLLTRLHICDSQKRLAANENFWLINSSAVNLDTFLREASAAGPAALMDSADDIEERYRLSNHRAINRAGAVLCVAPFLIPFSLRAKVFHAWMQEMREDSYSRPLLAHSDRTVSIRRGHIFEDAFEHFNGLGEELKSRIRVQFIDEHGLNEAGIDGGGVFKEFMHEVLKQGFAPYPYQFFTETATKQLYPNPNAHIANENYQTYFAFLGRMLGKAAFDGISADLPFARFFLSALLGHANYPSDLEFLDPEMYRNLKKLKDYDQDIIESLSLYFSLSNEVYGTTHEIELMRNGRNIQVTASNRIMYIYRVANYRLNTQIKKQTEAFIRGFSEVIPLQYIRLFFHDELQLLISGKPGKIDLQDWRRHTEYTGGYADSTPVIQWFWQALSELDAEAQGKVLQFVTSSPRPPLLGFSYMIPNFCIRRAEGDIRLPTASTCVNLLKLPQYSSLEVVREKLKYAVEAHAGFDLS